MDAHSSQAQNAGTQCQEIGWGLFARLLARAARLGVIVMYVCACQARLGSERARARMRDALVFRLPHRKLMVRSPTGMHTRTVYYVHRLRSRWRACDVTENDLFAPVRGGATIGGDGGVQHKPSYLRSMCAESSYLCNNILEVGT